MEKWVVVKSIITSDFTSPDDDGTKRVECLVPSGYVMENAEVWINKSNKSHAVGNLWILKVI